MSKITMSDIEDALIRDQAFLTEFSNRRSAAQRHVCTDGELGRYVEEFGARQTLDFIAMGDNAPLNDRTLQLPRFHAEDQRDKFCIRLAEHVLKCPRCRRLEESMAWFDASIILMHEELTSAVHQIQ